MIWLREVSKGFGANRVARRVTATFPTGVSVALLGRNGAGKSTLLRLIAGTTAPDSGQIATDGSVSWPVGFAGGFHPDLTGAQNVRFLARIYGAEPRRLLGFVAEFADLGPALERPFRTYSAGMRARLAFGASMGLRFDTYLVDEVTSVGDAAFRRRSEEVLRARLADSGAVVVSHSLDMLRRLCEAGAVLEGGRLTYFPRLEAAIRHYEAGLGQAAG